MYFKWSFGFCPSITSICVYFLLTYFQNVDGMKEFTAEKKLTQSFYVLPPLYEKLQRLTGTNITILKFIFTFIQMA